MPVVRDGEVIYDISFSPPIELFQALIEKQRPSQDWTISIFDGDGINFARVPNPQATIGKRASPSLYAEMFRRTEATLQTVSLEGVPLITTFARSSLTGWTIAAGIAERSLVGPLWRNLAITSVIGGVLLLIGLAFAVRMATAIARGEMLHDLLIEELNHRVKNTLAILQSIAVQTFRSASKSEREKFEGRLGALAETHNLLSEEKWRGSELQDVVSRVMQPYLLSNPERLRMFGPKVPLSPRLAVVLSMIVHEIATNAAKYGALSNDTGTVTLDWEVIQQNGKPKLRLIWRETGGPHVVSTGAARIRIAPDRAQRARPARRRGYRRFPAARRGLYRDLRAGGRRLEHSPRVRAQPKFCNTGNVSSSQMLTLETAPVRKPMPVRIINTPIARSTLARCRFIFANSEENCSTMKAAIRNGMPSPAE